jgi:hypothetical protein
MFYFYVSCRSGTDDRSVNTTVFTGKHSIFCIFFCSDRIAYSRKIIEYPWGNVCIACGKEIAYYLCCTRRKWKYVLDTKTECSKGEKCLKVWWQYATHFGLLTVLQTIQDRKGITYDMSTCR